MGRSVDYFFYQLINQMISVFYGKSMCKFKAVKTNISYANIVQKMFKLSKYLSSFKTAEHFKSISE